MARLSIDQRARLRSRHAFVFRSVLTLVTCLSWLSQAPAILAPYREAPSREDRVVGALGEVSPRISQDAAYRVTDQTEVTLNGRKCRYDEVPVTAEVIFMEIDSNDSRLILRIHFRQSKGAIVAPIRLR